MQRWRCLGARPCSGQPRRSVSPSRPNPIVEVRRSLGAEAPADGQPIAVTARGRTVDEWKLLPGWENPFLDGAVLATAAASAAGITAVGAEMALERQHRRVEIPTTTDGRKRNTVKRSPRFAFSRSTNTDNTQSHNGNRH